MVDEQIDSFSFNFGLKTSISCFDVVLKPTKFTTTGSSTPPPNLQLVEMTMTSDYMIYAEPSLKQFRLKIARDPAVKDKEFLR